MARLALKDRAQARHYPGICFRGYVRVHGQVPWRSESIFEFAPNLQKLHPRITLDLLLSGSDAIVLGEADQ